MMTIGASANVVVESVSVVGKGIVVVLHGASQAASVTVQLSGEGLQQLGIVTGMILQASAVATGHLLISAGKVIAFIPNELGKALLHHERIN
jgi:hypothetical protein